MELETSFFENFGNKSQTVKLFDVLESIRNGDFKVRIEELRGSIIDERKYGDLKKSLPHFTPSGTFEPNRRAENLCKYSGVVVIDIDKVGEKAQATKILSSEIDFTLSAFVSPSGEGVKILVKTDSDADNHERTFESIVSYYENRLGIAIDRSGKDISRACFVSYDSELYLNEGSSVFSSTNTTPVIKFSTVTSTDELEMTFQAVLNFTQKIDSYTPGTRNNFIYKLANNLNRAGINQHDAIQLISSNFTDSDFFNEIQTAANSAYTHTGEHGILSSNYFTSASFASSATTASRCMIQTTPFIPEFVYDLLPKFLKDCTSVFEVQRERDMFLTGALSILSGCFNNVEGKYDGRIFSPNLYSFTIAPPASGKGVLNFARQLASILHHTLKSNYEQLDISLRNSYNLPRGFYIPADSSSAAIKRMLVANSEQGTICETEADTLSTTLAQDWGGFDDLLRKAFQHEPVTFSRVDKDADEVVLREINHPKLSVCLTGTPSQVPTLLKSAENGLFSRFLFYTFRNDGIPNFKDVFADDEEISLDEFFLEKAKWVYKKYCEANGFSNSRFSLRKDQQETFTKQFDNVVKELHKQYGEDIDGIIFRLGLITFRLSMLLTIIRSIGNNTFSEKLVCSDDDFKISIALSEIYLQHSLAVFQSLPNSKPINHNAMTLFNFLPDEFTYSRAEQIGELYCGTKSRSISNYLKILLQNKLLIQPKRNGNYLRSNMQ